MSLKIYLCVLDSSVARAWLFAENATEETDKILDFLHVQPAIVPAVWHAEMAEMLLITGHKTDGNPQAIQARQRLLLSLPIHADETSATRVAWEALTLAKQKAELGISVRDAMYIALAQKNDTPLVTVDDQLANAARAMGVAVMP